MSHAIPRTPSQTLHSQIASSLRRKPVSVAPETTLRDAVLLMSEQRIGSIVIVEPESGRPIGIFTLRDLLHRVAAKTCDLDQMVMSVMSGSDLLTLNWRATSYQAALMMARHGVHHIIIVDASGKLVGIVSQEDIYEMQSGGGKEISGAIRDARNVEDLITAAAAIRQLVLHRMDEGASAEPLTQLVSTLNDHLTVRLIELTQQEFSLPKTRWCWFAFGSEGRFEQTLSTDQDNGICFAAAANGSENELFRQAFLPFARAMNERLATCGFPLCSGNVMASNPELCLSLDEWKEHFHYWMQAGNPQAILNATIYFDYRPLYGDESLADELRESLLLDAVDSTLFLRLMASNAVLTPAPVGVIRDFVTDKGGEFPGTINLKASGSRIFVDAARILSLAHGIGETSTAERLRALAERGKMGRDDIDAIIDSFFFIQRLRLRLQQEGDAAGLANRVLPDNLNELDRLILREAFKQAKKLQLRLQLEYRL